MNEWRAKPENLTARVESLADSPIVQGDSVKAVPSEVAHDLVVENYFFKGNAREVADHVFRSAPQTLLTTFSDDWAKRHNKIMAATLDKLPAAEPRATPCTMARMCLCLRPTLRSFVSALLISLRQHCPPKSGLRDLLMFGQVVLRFRAVGKPTSEM